MVTRFETFLCIRREKMIDIPSKEEIINLAKQLATPIDFEQLEKDGIIDKKGAWYKVIDFKNLPEYASRQISGISIENKEILRVKFPKSWKKAQALYRKMTGKEYNE